MRCAKNALRPDSTSKQLNGDTSWCQWRKKRQPNSLIAELHCGGSSKGGDSPAAVSGPASAVAGDFAPPAQAGPGDISSNSPGSSRATSADYPGRPADTPD